MDESTVQPTLSASAVPLLTTQPKSKKVYETDLRDRVLLVLTVGLGALLADIFLTTWAGFPGLGVTLLVVGWECVMLWYARGREKPMRLLLKPENLLLTLVVLLLAAVFALFTNRWFCGFNALVLPALMVVQMFSLFGKVTYSWSRPLMIVERGYLLLESVCWKWDAAFHTIKGAKGGPGKRTWYVLAGLAVAVPLVLLVLPLLTTADALFNQVAGEAIRFFFENFGVLLSRLLIGLFFAPFLFGLLYSLRRPEEAKLGLEKGKLPTADPAMAVTFLTVLDTLYLFFVMVQFGGLFGGKGYVEAAGLSFADYARSGFFQLVWVSAINLVVVLLAVQFTKRDGKLWGAARGLCTLMVTLSALMLTSAAARMTLYVTEYGLSFKRFLTYWGMVMLIIFFVAALLKIWKKDFAFFKVFFAASVAGWLVLNFCNVDVIVSRYNVNLYLSGNNAVMDLPYLAELSYDALPALEELDGTMKAYYDPRWDSLENYTLNDLIRDRRATAASEASSWRTWTLSAYLAAKQ